MKITAKSDCTLIQLLVEEIGASSRTKVKKMIKYGFISIGDKIIIKAGYKLKPGDVVELRKYHGVPARAEAPFQILFEDDYYIACLKPAGILSVKTEQEEENTCFHLLNTWLKDKTKGKERIHIVHRLDREVAGILLFAKTPEAREKIIDGWKDATKRYYALVEGIPPEKKGTVKSWLKEDGGLRVFSAPQSPDAKFAVTHYEVEKRVGKYTLLRVELETGRKNQIRVHMSDLGCPIVGDRKYGAEKRYNRQIRLFAYSLSFRHPFSGEMLEIRAKLTHGFLTPKDGEENYKTRS